MRVIIILVLHEILETLNGNKYEHSSIRSKVLQNITYKRRLLLEILIDKSGREAQRPGWSKSRGVWISTRFLFTRWLPWGLPSRRASSRGKE